MHKWYDSKQPLPSGWQTSVAPRSQAAFNRLHIDNLHVRYVGPGDTVDQAAAIRADHPVPPDVALYYFEVEILNRGQSGFIGVGFCTEDMPLGKLPGSDAHSYGYHGDDGCACFNVGTSRGTPYGPLYSTGDVVGALYNRSDRTISFYKNGVEIGVAFHDVKDEKLYPTVGMKTKDEEVAGNFGASPFRTDFTAVQKEFVARLWNSIKQEPLPSLGPKSANLVSQLIFHYLIHHRCAQTAEVVARELLGGSVELSVEQRMDIQRRQQIYDAILSRDIDTAMKVLREHYSEALLSNYPRIAFRLKCQKFIELVGSGKQRVAQEAIEYGRNELTPFPRTPEDQELFEDAISLLVYDEPEDSPAGHLLRLKHRQDLAEALNGAILEYQGRQRLSALECIYKQAEGCLDELRQLGDYRAPLLDMNAICGHKPS